MSSIRVVQGVYARAEEGHGRGGEGGLSYQLCKYEAEEQGPPVVRSRTGGFSGVSMTDWKRVMEKIGPSCARGIMCRAAISRSAPTGALVRSQIPMLPSAAAETSHSGAPGSFPAMDMSALMDALCPTSLAINCTLDSRVREKEIWGGGGGGGGGVDACVRKRASLDGRASTTKVHMHTRLLPLSMGETALAPGEGVLYIFRCNLLLSAQSVKILKRADHLIGRNPHAALGSHEMSTFSVTCSFPDV